MMHLASSKELGGGAVKKNLTRLGGVNCRRYTTVHCKQIKCFWYWFSIAVPPKSWFSTAVPPLYRQYSDYTAVNNYYTQY